MHSPSNIFGSLVSDTEDFFDDLQSHRDSIGRNIYGSTGSSPAFSPTPPFRTNSANRKPKMNVPGQFTDEEMMQLEKVGTAKAGTSKLQIFTSPEVDKIKDRK